MASRSSLRTPEASIRRSSSSSDHELSGSSEDFRRRRGRNATSSAYSSSSNSAKRFMSPTISAASKAVVAVAGPSPRRRILGERNDTALPSSSLDSPATEVMVLRKPAVMESKGSSGRELKPRPELVVSAGDAPCGELRKEGTTLRAFRISPAANVPSDDDSRLPPYDPNTNYLSPRPRFLHYRPNRRVEHYLHGKREFLVIEDAKCLDNCFSDDNCEDSSDCIDEEQYSDVEEECEEELSSMGSDGLPPSSIATVKGDTALGRTKEAGGKGHAFLGLKFALLLMFLIVVPFVWSAVSPSSSASVLQGIADLRIRDYVDASALNLRELACKLKHFSFSTAFGLHGTVATLPEIGPLYVDNFTVATSSDQRALVGYSYSGAMQSNDQRSSSTEVSHTFGRSGEEERSEGEGDMKVMLDAEVIGDVPAADAGSMEEHEQELMVEMKQDAIYETEKEDLGGETDQSDSSHESLDSVSCQAEGNLEQKIQEDGGNTELKDLQFVKQIEQDLGDVSTNQEVLVTGQEYTSGSFDPHIQPSSLDGVYSESMSKALNSQEHSMHASDANPWAKLVLGVTSALVLLAAASIFLFGKQNLRSQTIHPLENPSSTNRLPKSPVERRESYAVDTSDSAYGSPMDTYEFSTNLIRSTSIHPTRTPKGGEEEEHDDSLSLERRTTRRDSEGFSSSSSYGSYTAYEKLSAKKGAKCEEAMTPVRRSSRIKSQITS